MEKDSEDRTPKDVRIAYLSKAEFDSDEGKSYRGGALVVDAHGTPLEFRCTSPIRPNAVQRTLYGSSLDPFMLVQLMAKPLLASLREEFHVLLVDDRWFLNVRDENDTPALFVRRHGTDVTGEGSGDQDKRSALIDSPSGRFAPVVAETFHKNREDTNSVSSVLQDASAHIDLLEPFQRIQRALEKVHEEKAVDQR